MTEPRVLIVGAGPTGLAAALFLRQVGIGVRVIDRAPAPPSTSRALVVNPRTLELLEPTGVSDRMRAEGRAIAGARFSRAWEHAIDLDFAHVGFHMADPLIVLPQARSEALLTEALAGRGVQPERGVELVGVINGTFSVRAALRHADGRVESASAPLLFAADGAQSFVRDALKIGFAGSAFPEVWPLYDLHLKTSLDLDHAHVAFFDDGVVFALGIDASLWRVFGNVPDPLSRLPAGNVPGEIVWESKFHISHRVARRFAVGRVALGGDAAHVHSPVGARGLNLGIEDAFVFARLAQVALVGDAQAAMQRYGTLRRSVDRAAVQRIDALTRVARGASRPLRFARDHLLPRAVRARTTARRMSATVTGLDHEVRVD